MSDGIEFDNKGLENLIKALKDNKYVVKVGIFGPKNARTDGGSNASIGATHEFGTTKVARRSFLRMPLETQFPKELEQEGITDKDIDQILKAEGLKNFTEKIGILAVRTILKAFDSGGFGEWKSLSPITLKIRARNNQGAQILVRANSHQLRDSIAYEVKKTK